MIILTDRVAMKLSVYDISLDLGAKPAKRILDHVSFEAEEGQFLSLLGASGAGKSTLLKVIAGILIQDSGQIMFDGEAIDGLPSHKRGIGFVFQDMRLFPNMNVVENVAFPCKMAGEKKGDRLEHARHLLSCVHLDGFDSRAVSSLSGGQQQRVALARALAGNPRVLLLDEPFSGLDENLRDEMRSLVLNLQREWNITTVMVTHDATEALMMSDRIVYLSKGRVQQRGLPKDLFAHPATAEVAACFGACSVLEGAVTSGVFRRGAFEASAGMCVDGPARAIVRESGVSLRTCAAASLSVRCCVYQGAHYLARIDVEGQTLVVPVAQQVEAATPVEVQIAAGGCFVYPEAVRP
ncbi:MAG: ABC transporter ATP-binding protein [Raoultibacter sp.]